MSRGVASSIVVPPSDVSVATPVKTFDQVVPFGSGGR
eukprot:SAG31_NODE_45781_length_257_cov_0.955696_1_plen_36_part_01